MVQQLTNLEITRVSLVDKGANLRRLAVLKRDEEDRMTQPTTMLELPQVEGGPSGLAAFLRKTADVLLGRKVAKTSTFAEIVAGQELQNALYESWSTLQDALWQAIYAYDDAGQTLPLADRQALVGQNLDEFKDYLLAAMSTGVEKSAGSLAEAPSRHIAAIVAKVGRKISGSRLERLQAAAEALTGVLAEVVEETKDDSAGAQEDTVEKTELMAAVTEAVTKAQEPIVERLDKLEKAAAPAASGEAATAEASASGADAPATLDTVIEVVTKLAERLEAVEKGQFAGGRTSIAGQDGGTEVKKRGVWAGAF